MPRRKGESLDDYISRIAASTLARIRLSPDYYDPEGNIIVQPVVMFGKDTSDDIRPVRMDTSGRIDTIGAVPEYQTSIYLDQANPTSGTEYEVLPTTEYVRIYTIAARVVWTVDPDPLEIHITIDGQKITTALATPATATWYYMSDNQTAASWLLNTTADDAGRRAFLVEGRSVGVTAEITGGTVSALRCRLKYAKW